MSYCGGSNMTKRKYAGNLIYKSNEKISSLILKRLFSIAFSFPQLCSFLLLYIDINVCKYFFFSCSGPKLREDRKPEHHTTSSEAIPVWKSVAGEPAAICLPRDGPSEQISRRHGCQHNGRQRKSTGTVPMAGKHTERI